MELGGGGVEMKLSYKEMELEGRGARRKGSKGTGRTAWRAAAKLMAGEEVLLLVVRWRTARVVAEKLMAGKEALL